MLDCNFKMMATELLQDTAARNKNQAADGSADTAAVGSPSLGI